MTVSIIEGRTQGTDVWSPLVVGNANNNKGVRYISNLPKANAKTQKPTFATMYFNKDGGASESEMPRRQRIYESYAPLLHSMSRALGVLFYKYSWSNTEIERKHLRQVTFANHTELNKYLLEREIKPVVSGTEATVVTEVVIAQDKTVAELYQELGKVMASDPKAANAKAVVAQPLTEFKLTDDQLVLLQRNVQASLIKNAGQSIAKRLESQANSDIAKLYQEFGIKNPPTIKLVTEVLPQVKPDKAKK